MGRQKLLLPLGNKVVITRVVESIQSAPVDRIVVVVGRDREAIRTALQGREVFFVVNPDPEGDMLSSVRCGFGAVPDECEGVLIALGDHPTIRPTWIGELIQRYRQTSASIVVPVHRGRRGHPILVAATFREEILSEYDGVGLRGLLQAHAGEVTELEVSTPEVLEDLDTPEDYERLSGRFREEGAR
jgi:molybdenum cofactor cytidylyltransferase